MNPLNNTDRQYVCAQCGTHGSLNNNTCPCIAWELFTNPHINENIIIMNNLTNRIAQLFTHTAPGQNIF